MKLFINTGDREEIIVGLGEKKYRAKAREKASQMLLPLIVKALKKEGKDFKDISEIVVATGPGSFTGLRVGVSVANALGWALGVPVNGGNVAIGEIPEINYEDLSKLQS